VLQAPLADPQAPESYLFLEVISGNSHSTVSVSAVWETTQPPLRVPRIGVAITTFNREAFLVANLVRLDGHLAGGRVVVVNHGAPGLEDRLRDQLPETLAVSWIDQENSGGAGGFTRGMLEHREAGDITHVLLMDDDIDLPADLVERTAAVLSFTRPEICLGGAMFDYHERGHLFSAGDILLPGSFGIAHVAPPGGCDIGTTKGSISSLACIVPISTGGGASPFPSRRSTPWGCRWLASFVETMSSLAIASSKRACRRWAGRGWPYGTCLLLTSLRPGTCSMIAGTACLPMPAIAASDGGRGWAS
jgi:hypothetical protein